MNIPLEDDTPEAWERYFAHRLVMLYGAVYLEAPHLLTQADHDAVLHARVAQHQLKDRPFGDLIDHPPVPVAFPPSSSPGGNVVQFKRPLTKG